MNLLFDIDETITKENEFMVKHAPKYLKKMFHEDFEIVNPNGYDVCEVFGLKDYLMRNGISVDQLEFEEKKINSGFWNRYFVKYMFYPLKNDVPDIIRDLQSRGYKINFASLRGKKAHQNEKWFSKVIRTQVVPFLTRMQLKMNHVPYDQLFLVTDNKEKLSIAEDINAIAVFDDNIEVVESLNPSICAICVESLHNCFTKFQNKNIARIPFDLENIHRVMKEKNILKNNSKEHNIHRAQIKNLDIYHKFGTETFYKLARVIGKNYVMRKFQPIIIGKENLPVRKEPNVFVGNHRNIKDPLVTIAVLKDPVHFTALKRMFEYNENVFGKVGKNFGTTVTTWFVKALGCLPIARPTDKDYQITNLQTFQYISEYLKKESSVLIYPEGTLNRCPEKNGNILPLKSNHAFKVAERGKGIVRPFAIYWLPEKAKVENKVILSFLPPINTEKLKANEIAERWTASMNEALESMDKIAEEIIKINELPTDVVAPDKIKSLGTKK